MPRALLAGTLGLTCAAALVGAGLGSGCGPTQPTVVEVPDPAKLPDARPESIPDAPPPIATCIGHGDRPAIVRAAAAGADWVQFCASDGADLNECYSVNLTTSTYERLGEAPKPQPIALFDHRVTVTSTASTVEVCRSNGVCATLRPKGAGAEQLRAAASATRAVVLLGDAAAGKGRAELWDSVAGKKLGQFKYARAEFKCGAGKMLDETICISASTCTGPGARGALYSGKGRKIADVGGPVAGARGRSFGTAGQAVTQVDGATWAFLEEQATTLVLQNVVTGKLGKRVDLTALWAPAPDAAPDDDAAAPPAAGHRGEAMLVRGGQGTLVVITGGPAPGRIGLVDVATGKVTVVRPPACSP